MLSRALSLATVTLLIGRPTAGVARAAENLDAGKSPPRYSPTPAAPATRARGLLKNVSARRCRALRQHYTTGTDMPGAFSYLIPTGG
jgi:hypothetical protein